MGRRRLSVKVIETPKVDVVLRLQANVHESLADVAIAETIQQIAAERSRVSPDDSLGVIEMADVRRLSGEFRSPAARDRSWIVARRAFIVHQAAADEDLVVSVRRQVVVQFCDVRVELRG